MTWILLRAAGIGAYVMLFLSVAWGLVATTGALGSRIPRATSTTIHQFMSTVGLLLLGAHIGLLLIDPFMPFAPSAVFVPMRSSFKPIPVTFGVIAMYAMVLVLSTSWTRKYLGTAWWRRTHLLAVPTFTTALVHGVFAGSDTGRSWMWWMYAGSALAVLFLVLFRGLTVGLRPTRRAAPDLSVAKRTGRAGDLVDAAAGSAEPDQSS